MILSCDACSNGIQPGIVRDKVEKPLENIATGDEAGHPVGKPADGPLNHRGPDFTIGPGPLTPASSCVSLFPLLKTRHTFPPHGQLLVCLAQSRDHRTAQAAPRTGFIRTSVT